MINEKKYQFYTVLKTVRKFQYYKERNSIIAKVLKIFYLRRFNILSQKYRIYIKSDVGHNLKIWHENIIINKSAKIGDNVQLHGNNCIGNNGKDLEKCPKIGNNVEIGYGATIIGNIEIADGIIIGANSLVNKSFLESNVIIAGNPANIIKKR
ncbi:MAG: serine acetyltransferase [Clostridia bacterium]|nr:serine acetyltransferase [Clostridia bacterium]